MTEAFDNPAPTDVHFATWHIPGQPQPVAAQHWSSALATRLCRSPERWGWQYMHFPEPVPPPEIASRPVWQEPPAPDTSGLRRTLYMCIRRLATQVVLFVICLYFWFLIYPMVDSADSCFGWGIIIGCLFFGVRMIRRINAVRDANRNLDEFERPYRQYLLQERCRHDEATARWQAIVNRYFTAKAEVDALRASSPHWVPVGPSAAPPRIDVIGGDPKRHGWASLLATMGTSLCAGGYPVGVLDFTGQDVGGGLATIIAKSGWRVRHIELPSDNTVDILGGLSSSQTAECLAYALTSTNEESDPRHERALAQEVIACVIGCLDGDVTLARIGAGIQVFRQVQPGDLLTESEVRRLVEHADEFGHDEWAVRQLRFFASQLKQLGELLHRGEREATVLWDPEWSTVIRTSGIARDDRKDLLDHILVQVTQQRLRDASGEGRPNVLVVAGADHLGAWILNRLSDQARTAGVRLVLMIDHPRDDIERLVGTGGAVLVMKMYNHNDANLAAEFIGRGHRFVVSQVTKQVGSSFTDGGGDNFQASTNRGDSPQPRLFFSEGLSEHRGHAWSGTRNWGLTDNLSESTTTSRQYEFVVEPQQIMAMPETAVIVIDNTTEGRRVVMADCNPGTCLLERVALT